MRGRLRDEPAKDRHPSYDPYSTRGRLPDAPARIRHTQDPRLNAIVDYTVRGIFLAGALTALIITKPFFEYLGDAITSQQHEATITSPWQHRDICLRIHPSQRIPQEYWAHGTADGRPAVFLNSDEKEARTLERLLGEGDHFRFRDGSPLGDWIDTFLADKGPYGIAPDEAGKTTLYELSPGTVTVESSPSSATRR